MTKISVTIDVEVDQDWIDYCTQYNDLFLTHYCGYWMCGMEKDNDLGWLAYEYDPGGPNVKSIRSVQNSPEYSSIVEAWRAGNPLPDHWFRLDEKAAIKAFEEGVKRYGVDWYENGDATTYDVAIQMALLGEVVYG